MSDPSRPTAALLEASRLPTEAALRAGFGLPLVTGVRAFPFAVLLDGVPVDGAVAFSCRDGWVVRDVTDARGRVVRTGLGPVTERFKGEVSLRSLPMLGALLA